MQGGFLKRNYTIRTFSYWYIHISAQFLLEHGHHDTDSIMRGKAAVAFHNGNFKELYSIMEGRWVGNTIFANTFNTLPIMLAKTCFMFWFEIMSGKSVIRILQVIWPTVPCGATGHVVQGALQGSGEDSCQASWWVLQVPSFKLLLVPDIVA